jgi:hypothetical protein
MVDDELRKVAEDMRALARSLAKDFRDAVDQAHRSGRPTSEAFKHGLRGMADEVKRGAQANWGPPRYGRYGGKYGRRYGYGKWGYGGHGYGWNPPPPPPSSPESDASGSPPPSAPPCGPPWVRGHHHQRSRSPLPPVRRRWDATTIIGILAVLFGVAWLLGATRAVHVSVEAVVAIGLMLLGAAVVITGRTDWSLSRRSWPVWLGAAMILVLIATSSTFGVTNAFSFGNTGAQPSQSGTIHGGFGNVTVNASHLTPGDTVKIQSVAGQTFVNSLPAGDTIQVNAHVFAGQICVNGQSVSSGIGASTNQTLPGTGTPITLDIHQVFGQVMVGSPGCAGGHH